jgi:uncharacterized paraquat-inducible protein A
VPGVRPAAAPARASPGGKARCPCCGDTLATNPADPLDRPLAFAIAAAIVFVVANTTPLMGLSAVGRHASVGGLDMMASWQTVSNHADARQGEGR